MSSGKWAKTIGLLIVVLAVSTGMGDPDFCEKKCPICTGARQGNRLARFVQAVEMLVTFGGCPHGRARQRKYDVKPNKPLPPEVKAEP